MLNVYENRFNAKIIKLVANFNFLPLRVIPPNRRSRVSPLHRDQSDSKPQSPKDRFVSLRRDQHGFYVHYQSEQWRNCFWKIWFSIYIMQACYLSFRMIQVMLLPNFRKLPHVPVHFFWTCFSIVYNWWAYTMFIKWRDNTVGIFNEILSKLPGITIHM